MKGRVTRIGEIANVAAGGTPTRGVAKYYDGSIAWIKTLDLNGGTVIESQERITSEGLRSIRGCVNPPGTVMIAMYGGAGTIGKSGMLGIEAATNQAVASILPNPAIFDSRFLHYQLRYLRADWMQFSQGNRKDPNINKSVVESMPIWLPSKADVQREIANRLDAQFAEVETARQAAQAQLHDVASLANSIILKSVCQSPTVPHSLGNVLDEVKQGIGSAWATFPVLGATRSGLAPAKEAPGKQATKYKPVLPGSVFYNPMRILIGSIAFVDDNDAPGITSPDYVVLQGRPGVVNSRWFYYWLRSPLGEQCIASLARGAVRERMLFNRLAEGTIELPPLDIQEGASVALNELKPLRASIEQELQDIEQLPQRLLAQAFAGTT